MIVYVSIGNSAEQLSQASWSAYLHEVRSLIRRSADNIHGEWYSAPDSDYQNACFCAEIADPDEASKLRGMIACLRERYGQDSAAWAVVPVTEFI
jgi:hypothetical protein